MQPFIRPRIDWHLPSFVNVQASLQIISFRSSCRYSNSLKFTTISMYTPGVYLIAGCDFKRPIYFLHRLLVSFFSFFLSCSPSREMSKDNYYLNVSLTRAQKNCIVEYPHANTQQQFYLPSLFNSWMILFARRCQSIQPAFQTAKIRAALFPFNRANPFRKSTHFTCMSFVRCQYVWISVRARV